MRILKKLGLGLIAAISLVGCSAPVLEEVERVSPSTKGLRAGITAAEFETRPQVPAGLTLSYVWASGEETFAFDFSHYPRPDGGLDLTGRFLLEGIDVDPEALREIAAAIDAKGDLKGSAAELIKQDQIGLPVTGRADARFQLLDIKIFQPIRYEPHDCSFTLGSCEYKRFEQGQRAEMITSVITEENGIWRQVETGRDPRGGRERLVIEETLATYDKYGLLVALNGWELTEEGPAQFTIRRR